MYPGAGSEKAMLIVTVYRKPGVRLILFVYYFDFLKNICREVGGEREVHFKLIT